MKHLAILLFLFISPIVYGQTLDELRSLDIPLVVVNTVNNEEPTCTIVEHPEGCKGTGITDCTKVAGQLLIILHDDTLYNSKEYEADRSGMTIRIRGNSSATTPKKPFKIALEKKADLLLRGNDSKYKDKSWLLLKEERSHLNTFIGNRISEYVTKGWVPAGEYVNVIFNGDFRGLYILSENIKRNQNCRIDVDESGYIFEWDAYWWNEDQYFSTTLSEKFPYMNFTFKYPDVDEGLDEQRIEYLKEYLISFEESIASGGYEEFIDTESFVRWILSHDILGNDDMCGSNIFLTKQDANSSKIKMGPLWDFGRIRRCKSWVPIHDNFYFYELIHNTNHTFPITYKTIWQDIAEGLVPYISECIDSVSTGSFGASLGKSIEYNNARWKTNLDLTTDAAEAKQWFESRKEWLDWAIGQMWPPLPSAIHSVYNHADNTPEWYDISGKQISNPSNGLYIYQDQNGKHHKVLLRH